MRTGAAAGHVGYYHEAILFDSEEHLLAVVVPFLLGGVEAGEPAVVGFGARNAELVRRALPAGSGVTFLPGGDVYARPTSAIRAYRKLLAGYVAEGATQIRIVGELPPQTLGATWDWWARYEAAINHAYDDFPLWSMCAYDTRVASPQVLADVARTHPREARPDGSHLPIGDYTEPTSFLAEPRAMLLDPVQRTAPLVELTDPTAAEARAAVQAADRGQVPADDVEDLKVAVSEMVTNALRHGQPPTRMRLWSGPDRIVVTVQDRGDGPKDPYAGLLPAGDGATGGLGLWISHQSCNHVALHRHDDGFTVRLTAGNPYFPV
ncbi:MULTISPECIES: sensor histidine kinase [Micromonospora]|uniref:Sensor histidine kinase n=1 Tax=Micromonospora solifontis TaxID=2487138 RepID=A0ABX9WNF6_9ACTN|nr:MULTISPECIES: sensor histidine kinase [Micromonospora]NES14874.1 sensor histidine kinase [Micromonospora sp. PPF5-17B]NES35203.1 sensor histidine kinase [Micromonospora solifontis]NES55198.1 sensor histidine kinase [Micromonospora sp. PPF5-6]RNM01181.1 sensor histidine kinase [Micromonospora solifontis]